MLFTLILFWNNCSFWLLVDTYRVLRLFSKLDWLFCDSVMMIWWVFLSSVAFCSKAYLKQILKRWIELLSYCQVKLPFEKLLHALRNFPEEATDPDVLLPMAFTFKVINLLCKSYSLWLAFFVQVASFLPLNFPIMEKTKSCYVPFPETIFHLLLSALLQRSVSFVL